ncbi:MAG: thiamine pyrophosphate-binding protein [Spirochaetes bacterium]|nr:thiamine pyrophosphate-binding protein [Spirochaetota bacterium]
MNGGEIVAHVLYAHGVDALFTLIGGHISPILVEAKRHGIRVIDTRHEVNAVFAADAWARLKGIPGVAAVTAGPGVTNTITAVRNALMAESPLVLIGGATATALKGRGSLQDIDQIALIRTNVKKAFRATRVKDIAPILSRAFKVAASGVPGPVFVELPVDLLYDEKIVREWHDEAAPKGKGLLPFAIRTYLKWHVDRLFAGAQAVKISKPERLSVPKVSASLVAKIQARIVSAERPLILAGSETLSQPQHAKEISAALESLGVPVYLSGMARGLLGTKSAVQYRQKRKEALREADLIILLGVPADFRLNYGAHLNRRAYHINVNLDKKNLTKNKRPNLAARVAAGALLMQLAEKGVRADTQRIAAWKQTLAEREKAREAEIQKQAANKMQFINPVDFFLKSADVLVKKTILIADGGDFVATGAYILKPGGPLTWLDPGVFGTLGVGAGFALGAKVARPDHDVVILYGDGSAGYSIIEFDTFVRHKLAIGAIIGNDACWTQIYRDQKVFLEDDVACMLDYSHYDEIAKTFGGAGATITKPTQIKTGIAALKKSLAKKTPFVLNVLIGRSEFRKGSISM